MCRLISIKCKFGILVFNSLENSWIFNRGRVICLENGTNAEIHKTLNFVIVIFVRNNEIWAAKIGEDLVLLFDYLSTFC